MLKRLSSTILMIVLVTACSSPSSDLESQSKDIVQIVSDYMENGEEVTESEQRKIDAYLTKYATNLDSYNEKDQLMINTVTDINNQIFYYTNYQKDSDKKKAMERYFEKKEIFNKILELE